jgi:Synergist-CTERM protein sorting domain-containing protein
MTTPAPLPPVADEQLRYARWLDWGAKAGFAALVVGFLAYATGLLPAQGAVQAAAGAAALPLDRYLAATGTPTGGDGRRCWPAASSPALVGIALLAGCSALCLLAIVPLYLRRRDTVYAVVCILEIAVLALATSGVLTSGH